LAAGCCGSYQLRSDRRRNGGRSSYDIAEIVDTEYHVVARMNKQALEGVLAGVD
jgi:hypothetical protein